MATKLSDNISDLEKAKFKLTPVGGKIAVRICAEPTDPIPVFITQAADPDISNTFGTISGVASAATGTIVSFTVPVGKTLFLKHIEVSGNNIAIYTVEISSTVEAKKRTWFGGNIATEFDFASSGSGFEVIAGTTIDVKVENFRPSVGDFEGRILGLLL